MHKFFDPRKRKIALLNLTIYNLLHKEPSPQSPKNKDNLKNKEPYTTNYKDKAYTIRAYNPTKKKTI